MKSNKEEYVKARMEIIYFENEDIITASNETSQQNNQYSLDNAEAGQELEWM